MADHFFDSSAVVKNYHSEAGSARVQAILLIGGGIRISRLTIVEVHSAMAKKVRVGQIPPTRFKHFSRRFRKDILQGLWSVRNVKVPQYQVAERLVRRIAIQHNLRSLDAIQLAMAISLNTPTAPITFVCADQALCSIAAAEGLAVINPEVP